MIGKRKGICKMVSNTASDKISQFDVQQSFANNTRSLMHQRIKSRNTFSVLRLLYPVNQCFFQSSAHILCTLSTMD